MPLFAVAQQGWVSIAIQGDGYGEETTWLVKDSSNAIVAGSAPLQGEYPYVEAFLPLPLVSIPLPSTTLLAMASAVDLVRGGSRSTPVS